MKVLTNEEFPQAIKEGIVLVDFFADWCGPCKMLAPVIEELSKEYADKVSFYKVNVDESGEVAGQFGIMSIPTLIIFKNGVKVSQEVGYQPKDAIEEMLRKYLG